MSIEAFTPPDPFLVAGIGPYEIDHPYRGADDFVVTAVDGETFVILETDDWSVSPETSLTTGDLTLTASAATTYDGQDLFVVRKTVVEQGWVGLLGAREKGLETQLDYLAMAIQELVQQGAKTFSSVGAGSGIPVKMSADRALIVSEDGLSIGPGPTADEISSAQQYAEDAQQSKDDLGDFETAMASVNAARDKAQDWAEEDEDTEVETGQYSAKHHSAKSSEQRVLSESARQASEGAQTASEAARDAAFVNADVYADVATGRAAVADTEQFMVVSTDGTEVIRYRRDSASTETEMARYSTASYVNGVGGREFITFTLTGSYVADGTISAVYGYFHKEHAISKTGLYEIGWGLSGSVRYIHAVDVSDNILASWHGDEVGLGSQIAVPEGATKLLLTSTGSPQNGYLTLVDPLADGDVRGIISESEVTALAVAAQPPFPDTGFTFAYPNEVEHFDMRGNLWSDGLWRNSTSTDTFARVYTIDPAETYMLLNVTPVRSFEQAISTAEINSQLTELESFSPLTHNASTLNNLAADCDDITVNGYTSTVGVVASEWTPPAGAKRLIVMTQYGVDAPVDRCRLFKTGGRARGDLAGNPNSGKSIAVCGDSVAQGTESEIGKSRLRGHLGSRVDTYAMGGAGWSINATPGWVTPNNISGVYQVEELVKPATRTYDIYCLSATLNDPITHNKPIGNINNCYPYLKTGSDPDMTDPNLDTMLGALNFAIQRIYEKNPSAKIVIGTMNKAFLTTQHQSGFGVNAGHDPADTTTNISGATYYQYVEAVRSLGDRWSIPIVDVYGKAGINEYNKAQMMKDAYHPTTKGYESIWSLWLDAILRA